MKSNVEIKVIAVVDQDVVEDEFENDVSNCQSLDFFVYDYCVSCIVLDGEILFCSDNIHDNPDTFLNGVRHTLAALGYSFSLKWGFTVAQDPWRPTPAELNSTVWDK